MFLIFLTYAIKLNKMQKYKESKIFKYKKNKENFKKINVIL